MRIRNRSGFTLIEVIVVAGIIAILAGILVPLIFKEIESSRTSRAMADEKSIMAAITVLKKDTGQWPVMDGSCTAAATLMAGNGTDPANLAGIGFDLSVRQILKDHLTQDTNSCYNNWKGPYIADVTPDPWGNAYIINANAFNSGSPVWIISAGPDGTMTTPPNSSAVVGDDLGLRIE